MKKLMVILFVILMALLGCAAHQPSAPAESSAILRVPKIEAPVPPPCDGKAVVIQIKEVVANGKLLVFVWLDNTCDGQCDGVAVLLYLGKFEGKPSFQPLGLVSCEDADEAIRNIQAQNKQTTGGA